MRNAQRAEPIAPPIGPPVLDSALRSAENVAILGRVRSLTFVKVSRLVETDRYVGLDRIAHVTEHLAPRIGSPFEP